jgi:hypothetical protein
VTQLDITSRIILILRANKIPLRFAGTQRCNTFLDLLVKIIDMIFRRRGTSVCPPGATPAPRGAGGAPPQDEAGGDPPGGASVPPADAEELDPSQNDAIRDWE